MTIEFGDSPEGLGMNKFLTKHNEGMRGKLMAVSKDRTRGIIFAMNEDFANTVKSENLYMVKEINANEYPRVVRKINTIPLNFILLEEK